MSPEAGEGRVIDDLVDFTDFLPTLADAADLTMPENVSLDGMSFWERLRGDPGQPREWIYTYYFPVPYAWHFIDPPASPPGDVRPRQAVQALQQRRFFRCDCRSAGSASVAERRCIQRRPYQVCRRCWSRCPARDRKSAGGMLRR